MCIDIRTRFASNVVVWFWTWRRDINQTDGKLFSLCGNIYIIFNRLARYGLYRLSTTLPNGRILRTVYVVQTEDSRMWLCGDMLNMRSPSICIVPTISKSFPLKDAIFHVSI